MKVLWLIVICLALSSCLVLKSSYEDEVQRGRELSERLEMSEAESEERKRRIHELEASRETLKLEQEGLAQERFDLLEEIEEIRQGNDRLLEQLEEEKRVRETRETEIQEISGTYQDLVEHLEDEIETGQIEIHRLKGRVQVRAQEQILFDSGSAELKPAGREVLAKLAGELREMKDHHIRVEGHTDTVPIATPRFPSNWELGGARAAGVVRLLIEQGLQPAKLEAVGLADHQPIADNTTPEGRARNRRIEIVLVPAPSE